MKSIQAPYVYALLLLKICGARHAKNTSNRGKVKLLKRQLFESLSENELNVFPVKHKFNE